MNRTNEMAQPYVDDNMVIHYEHFNKKKIHLFNDDDTFDIIIKVYDKINTLNDLITFLGNCDLGINHNFYSEKVVSESWKTDYSARYDVKQNIDFSYRSEDFVKIFTEENLDLDKIEHKVFTDPNGKKIFVYKKNTVERYEMGKCITTGFEEAV